MPCCSRPAPRTRRSPRLRSGCKAELGIGRGFGFDISAACSGFVYAVATADALIRVGQAQGVLVIGAEVYSRILNWEDRGTCVLFGDGRGCRLPACRGARRPA